MARIECRACGYDGHGPFEDVTGCPRCGSLDCRAALGISDMPLDFVERIAAARVEALGAGSTDPEEYAAFLKAGHEPMTVVTENGALVLDSSGEGDDGWRGVECRLCGWYNEGLYAASAVPPCDGAPGKARRFRGRARRRKAMWEKAEAAARQAEREAGVLKDPLGYYVSDIGAAARLMADDVLHRRDPEARAAEREVAKRFFFGDGESLGDVLRRYNIADAEDARDWRPERLWTLALDLLATARGRPARQAEAVLRHLAARGRR